MVDNVFEEIALSYRRNTEQQEEFCEKHNIPLIKILRTESVVCRMCESERIHEENQERVNELANAENERERKYYLEKFSLYDEVLKNATLDNFETPTEKEAEKLALQRGFVVSGLRVLGTTSCYKEKLEQVRAIWLLLWLRLYLSTRKRLLSSST